MYYFLSKHKTVALEQWFLSWVSCLPEWPWKEFKWAMTLFFSSQFLMGNLRFHEVCLCLLHRQTTQEDPVAEKSVVNRPISATGAGDWGGSWRKMARGP